VQIVNRRVVVATSALVLVVPFATLTEETPQPASLEPDPPSECNAVVGQLVANCGFETGKFSDVSRRPSLPGDPNLTLRFFPGLTFSRSPWLA
jgi:hypothetical protein